VRVANLIVPSDGKKEGWGGQGGERDQTIRRRLPKNPDKGTVFARKKVRMQGARNEDNSLQSRKVQRKEGARATRCGDESQLCPGTGGSAKGGGVEQCL